MPFATRAIEESRFQRKPFQEKSLHQINHACTAALRRSLLLSLVCVLGYCLSMFVQIPVVVPFILWCLSGSAPHGYARCSITYFSRILVQKNQDVSHLADYELEASAANYSLVL